MVLPNKHRKRKPNLIDNQSVDVKIRFSWVEIIGFILLIVMFIVAFTITHN